jgi:phospholipid/cholesterol/gamma-HCH transport system substrate-binding protein
VAAVLVAASGARTAGLTETGFTVQAEFASAAGLSGRSPVTYRGVRVGRVTGLRLTPGGVRATLLIEPGTKAPASTEAVIANRNLAGDPYIDLRPRDAQPPYLRDGSVIPANRTATPVAAETVLTGASQLVTSLRPAGLAAVIDELASAFDGNGPALKTLLDAQHTLTTQAESPDTVALLDDSRTALRTQAAQAPALRTWSRGLADLSGQLAAAEPDLRRLIASGTTASREVNALVGDVQPELGVLLSNLIVVGQVQARRVGGIRQILASYPAVVAQGRTILPGDGTAHLGIVLNEPGPPPCAGKRCTKPPGTADDPGPVPLGPRTPAPDTTRFAGFDPATGLALGPDGRPLTLGSTGGQQALVGEQSWKSLLLGPLAR